MRLLQPAPISHVGFVSHGWNVQYSVMIMMAITKFEYKKHQFACEKRDITMFGKYSVQVWTYVFDHYRPLHVRIPQKRVIIVKIRMYIAVDRPL